MFGAAGLTPNGGLSSVIGTRSCERCPAAGRRPHRPPVRGRGNPATTDSGWLASEWSTPFTRFDFEAVFRLCLFCGAHDHGRGPPAFPRQQLAVKVPRPAEGTAYGLAPRPRSFPSGLAAHPPRLNGRARSRWTRRSHRRAWWRERSSYNTLSIDSGGTAAGRGSPCHRHDHARRCRHRG